MHGKHSYLSSCGCQLLNTSVYYFPIFCSICCVLSIFFFFAFFSSYIYTEHLLEKYLYIYETYTLQE